MNVITHCRFCQADGRQMYFRNDTALLRHFTRHHYVCDHPDCLHRYAAASPDSIAFRDPIALRTHHINFHADKANMSKAELKHLQTVDVAMFRQQANSSQHGHPGPRARRLSAHDRDQFEWQTGNASQQQQQQQHHLQSGVIDDADVGSDEYADSDASDVDEYPALNNLPQAQRDAAAQQQAERSAVDISQTLSRPTTSTANTNGWPGRGVPLSSQTRSDMEFPALPASRPGGASEPRNLHHQAKPQQRSAAQTLFGQQIPPPSSAYSSSSSRISNYTSASSEFPSLSSLAPALSQQPQQQQQQQQQPAYSKACI